MQQETPQQRRLEALRQILAQQPFDTFLVSEPWNRAFLSGFYAEDLHITESSGVLFVSQEAQVLATDFRYQEQAERQAAGFEVIIYQENLANVLPEIFARMKTKDLGFESAVVTYARHQELEAALKAWRPGGRLVATDGLVERLRVSKEPGEVEAIRNSLRLTEAVMEQVLAEATPGMSERELAWRIEMLLRQGGADAVAFPPIVASGPNAAMPHAAASDRQLRPGETVIIDMGARLRHYCSDMTRTLILGPADAKTREIYAIVRQAQQRAIEAMRPGISSFEVDRVAREFIASKGYGDFFGHGLGHGVGLAVHERPGFGKTTAMMLAENMVVTVEPGIYLPGWGGVRLENMVRLTAAGAEVLNEKELFYEFAAGGKGD